MLSIHITLTISFLYVEDHMSLYIRYPHSSCIPHSHSSKAFLLDILLPQQLSFTSHLHIPLPHSYSHSFSTFFLATFFHIPLLHSSKHSPLHSSSTCLLHIPYSTSRLFQSILFQNLFHISYPHFSSSTLLFHFYP